MKYILILALFLTGCSGGSGGGSAPKQQTIIFYGDSIGRQLEQSDHNLPFVFDTEPGRKITDLRFTQLDGRKKTVIDYSYDVIYIELGTNDKDMDAAELHLLQLLNGFEDKIICVLPMTRKNRMELPFRPIMQKHCINIIDPLQDGVYPLDSDNIHLWGADNIKHYESIFSSK